jgi:hypothetical protein
MHKLTLLFLKASEKLLRDLPIVSITIDNKDDDDDDDEDDDDVDDDANT